MNIFCARRPSHGQSILYGEDFSTGWLMRQIPSPFTGRVQFPWLYSAATETKETRIRVSFVLCNDAPWEVGGSKHYLGSGESKS